MFGLANANLTTWSKHWQAANGITTGSPRITFTGFTIGGNQFYPRHRDQEVWSVRDDFTFSYKARGRHDLKTGGEFLTASDSGELPPVHGRMTPAAGPPPANLEALFPDPFNADTWNMAAISPLVRTYGIGVGDFDVHIRPRRRLRAGLQDDWQTQIA